MQNLFDVETYNKVIERLNNLNPQSQKQWGKMDVSQMLAHVKEAFKIPLSEKELPRMFIGRLLGWFIKSKLYDDSPWKPGLPTSPNFVIKDDRIFEKEKQELLSLVNRFHQAGPGGITKFAHPFFGKFTPVQWGQSMYKHLDHHLRQFSV